MFLGSSSAFAEKSQFNFNVPSDWLTDSNFSLNENAYDPAFEKGTDLILNTHFNALKAAKKVSNLTSWHLHSVIFDLSVGTEGRLGALLFRGTPSVNVYWTKKNNNKHLLAVNSSDEAKDKADQSDSAVIRSDRELDAQIRTVVSGIYASGKVNYSKNLEGQIKDIATNFFAIMNASQLNENQRWKVSKMRLDLNVGASGNVTFIQTVGGTVRLRLDWVPSPRINLQILNSQQHEVKYGIQSTLTQVMNELDIWSQDKQVTQFQLSTLRVGLGMGSRFQIGLARSSASAIVHVYFVPNTKATMQLTNSPVESDSTDGGLSVSLVDNQSSWAQVLGADDVGPNFTSLPFESVVINRSRIQEGLNRALRIGNFFAARSSTVLNNSDWYVSRIKTGLDLTLTGTLQLATLQGLVTMEAFFDNK